MNNLKSITFQVHNPLEFLYSMFAIGTGKHFYNMIKEFDLVPNNMIKDTIDDMKKGLSRYTEHELGYFFDLHGIGYIFYKYVLLNPSVRDIQKLLDIFNNSDALDFVFLIVKSTCKTNMPDENSEAWEALKHSSNNMMRLVEDTVFQDDIRKERVIEIIENPDEVKQRFYLLLSQFYLRCYKPVEEHMAALIEQEKSKYAALFNNNPELFMEQYLNLSSNSTNAIIHLSFFKYVGCHHYSLYKKGFSDFYILGIYTNLLFSQDISADRLSNFFKSLSDPNRLEILKLLSERPWFGQELAEKLNITPATISYHMGFLQKIGAVTFIRADNRSYYSLNDAKLIKPLEEFINYFKKSSRS